MVHMHVARPEGIKDLQNEDVINFSKSETYNKSSEQSNNS